MIIAFTIEAPARFIIYYFLEEYHFQVKDSQCRGLITQHMRIYPSYSGIG